MGIYDETPTYGCGHAPAIGDIVEFGTRHRRMMILEIDDNRGNGFTIYTFR